MTVKETRNTARPRLSRQGIIEAALALANEEGLDKLSMRRLALRLGVEAMSLYNHVSNKDDLLDGLVERVVSEFAVPDEMGDWKEEMRRRAFGAHEVLMRYPWASLLIVSRVNGGANMFAYVNATLGCLTRSGFSIQMADRVWNALDSHIYGFTLQALRFPFRPEEYQHAAQAYIGHIPRDRLPHLHALTLEVAEGRHFGVHDFSFGLNLLLDSLEKLPERARACA
jgi:AcrR family transcriptional regulator